MSDGGSDKEGCRPRAYARSGGGGGSKGGGGGNEDGKGCRPRAFTGDEEEELGWRRLRHQ